VQLELGAATDWEPRKGWNAWIVTNPPYGERVGTERGLEDSYRRFGQLLSARGHGYRLALLTSSQRLGQSLGLSGLERRVLLNGPLECELLTGPIP
jgi:23S rRNA (guanine2445-N2)-methyltransferase / 23S rRNA (guanine2069-N7)-methyltransferase